MDHSLVKDLVVLPSLKEMSLNAVTSGLWLAKKIRPLLTFYPGIGTLDAISWCNIEFQVTKNVPDLKIPNAMMQKIFALVNPIGKQIHDWLHRDGFGFTQANIMDANYVKTHMHFLHWTPFGSLDMSATMLEVVRDESLSPDDRFRMACDYCLETEIRKLWKRIRPVKLTQDFWARQLMRKPLMIRHWTYLLENVPREYFHQQLLKFNPDVQPYIQLFTLALENGTLQAMRYFWEFLSWEDRITVVLLQIPRLSANYTAVNVKWYFLFSEFTIEMALTQLLAQPEDILRRFASCPYPYWTFFKDLVSHLWDGEKMPFELYVTLLKGCLEGLNLSYGNCRKGVYIELYKYLYDKAPQSLRQKVLDNEVFAQWLDQNFQSGIFVTEESGTAPVARISQYVFRNSYF